MESNCFDKPRFCSYALLPANAYSHSVDLQGWRGSTCEFRGCSKELALAVRDTERDGL